MKMKMNTISLNFPSPRSEPREVIEVGFVHEHVKVLIVLILVTHRTGYAAPINVFANSYPLLGAVLGQMPTKFGNLFKYSVSNTACGG